MHDIQRRRRCNQTETDQLILEFQKSDLSPQEFAQNVGVQVQTVVRWLKTASVDLTHRSNRNADRRAASDSSRKFVAVNVVAVVTGGNPGPHRDLSSLTFGLSLRGGVVCSNLGNRHQQLHHMPRGVEIERSIQNRFSSNYCVVCQNSKIKPQ